MAYKRGLVRNGSKNDTLACIQIQLKSPDVGKTGEMRKLARFKVLQISAPEQSHIVWGIDQIGHLGSCLQFPQEFCLCCRKNCWLCYPPLRCFHKHHQKAGRNVQWSHVFLKLEWKTGVKQSGYTKVWTCPLPSPRFLQIKPVPEWTAELNWVAHLRAALCQLVLSFMSSGHWILKPTSTPRPSNPNSGWNSTSPPPPGQDFGQDSTTWMSAFPKPTLCNP